MPRIHKSCCCCDDTKESTGLPDAIEGTFLVTSSGCGGMPSDSAAEVLACGTSDYVFDCDSTLVDLLEALSLITFDYSGSAASTDCGACCFAYTHRGTYQPACPEDATADKILLGTSPFGPRGCGGSVQVNEWTGTSVPNPDASEPYVGDCCPTPTTTSCKEYCGSSVLVTDGELQAPQDLFLTATLFICVVGSVVTICITINVYIPCGTVTSEGSCAADFNLDHTTSPPIDGCVPNQPHDEIYPCDAASTEGCAISSTTIELTATEDLSMTSGANIWEKIKNFGAWEFDYEYAACSCAGGCCAEQYAYCLGECGILSSTCDCIEQNPFQPGSNATLGLTCDDLSGPVDIQCLYSVGTLEVGFTDE